MAVLTDTHGEALVKRPKMPRCSSPVYVATCLGLLTWLAWAWWTHQANLLPDVPQVLDGKNFIHTPRSDALLGVFASSVVLGLIASCASLVALAWGPRRRACLLGISVGPMFVVLGFLRVSGLLEWLP